jgi:cardiolipin synthase
VTLLTENWGTLLSIGVILVEIVAIGVAIRAIMTVRTSQGAIAWAVALVSFPYLSLPLYFFFGRNRFHGYVLSRRAGDLRIHHITRELARDFPAHFRTDLTHRPSDFVALEKLAKTPFTNANHSRLLIDGEATFDAIFEALDQAREYVLIQFFIVHDDGLGQRLHRALAACAQRGVRVYFLIDAIGSHDLPDHYAHSLREHGVQVAAFNARSDRRSRFQINFRNHRKIVVVDGEQAFLGGHNVGDEYLGLDRKLSPWRDTHVALRGPAVLGAQLAFMEDWHWVTGEVPTMSWEVEAPQDANQDVLIVPTGPADEQETGSLLFAQLINMARRRLWIVSPYFVPDQSVTAALQLAALRGVDVRILIPRNPDHRLVHLAAQAYFPAAIRDGIGIYRYRKGFLHQKVALVDDEVSAIGTANLDNRSLRLNFEVTAITVCPRFAQDVERMLEADFVLADRVTAETVSRQRLPARVAFQVARLFAPIL